MSWEFWLDDGAASSANANRLAPLLVPVHIIQFRKYIVDVGELFLLNLLLSKGQNFQQGQCPPIGFVASYVSDLHRLIPIHEVF